MKTLFEGILYLSAFAVFLVPLVFLVRLLIRKAPATFAYVLWLMVFFRLASPVWVTTEFGIMPEPDRLWTTAAELPDTADKAVPQSGAAGHSQTAVPVLHENMEPKIPGDLTVAIADGQAAITAETRPGAEQVNRAGAVSTMKAVRIADILPYLWLAGLALMLAYTALRYFFFLKKTDGIRIGSKNRNRRGYRLVESRKVPTPFTAGIFHPTIYLPAQMESAERKMILEHEKMHIRRRDYLVKAFAWLMVCVYWFHPFVWLSFLMLERDMELSCDEAVIRKLGSGSKRAYALTLLHFSAEKPAAGCFPVAFGEKSAASRIRRVVEVGRIKISAVLFAMVLLLMTALAACVNRSVEVPAVNGQSGGSETVVSGQPGGSETAVNGQPGGSETVVNGQPVEQEETDTLSEQSEGETEAEVLSSDIEDSYRVLLRDYEPEEQMQQTRTFWSVPVANARISATYGRRIHPVTKQETWHEGIDFAAESGAAVTAAAGGTVLETGFDSTCGKYVILAHKSGELTYYANCSEILVKEGKWVERGDEIAKVGNTGASTGAHLHFAVSYSGSYEIPLMQEAVTEADSGETWLLKSITKAVLQGNSSRYGQGETLCAGEGHVMLDMAKEHGGELRRIYALTRYGEYRLVNGAMEKQPSTGTRPTVILLQMREDGAHLPLEISWPLEGNQYEESVRQMFPKEQWEKVFSPSEEICRDLEEQEAAYAKRYLANHPEEVEKSKEVAAIGIPVLLPANTSWISEREYRKVNENRMEVRYHDAVLDSDFTVYVVKNGELPLPDQHYEEALSETWNGRTAEGTAIDVKLRHDPVENNVLVTWEYREYQYAISGQLAEGQTDASPAAKTALYIIEHLE